MKFKKEVLDRDKKIAINCKTKEETCELFDIAHRHGLKWCHGASYTSSKLFLNKDECYILSKGTWDTREKLQNFTILNYDTDKHLIFEDFKQTDDSNIKNMITMLESLNYTVTKNKMSIDEIITQLKEEVLSNGKPFNSESKCCHNIIIKSRVLVSDAQNSLLDNHFTFSQAIKIAEKYNQLLKENGHID